MLWQLVRPLAYVSACVAMLSTGWFANSAGAAMMLGDQIPLSELLDDGEVVVGDKKFTDFTYSFTGDMPDAAGVNVIPIVDDDGYFGISFQGFFTDLASTQGGSDALINYSVMVTDPLRLISDAHMAGNPTLGVGSERRGLVNVVETFLPLGQNGEHTMVISDDEAQETPNLVAWTFFDPPVPMLRVQKDIGAIAVPGFPSPSISFIDQTFSQIIIPEPTTALLSACGIAALFSLRRRRHRVTSCD